MAKKSFAFRVGRVRAFIRGRVWYLSNDDVERQTRDDGLGSPRILFEDYAARGRFCQDCSGTLRYVRHELGGPRMCRQRSFSTAVNPVIAKRDSKSVTTTSLASRRRHLANFRLPACHK